MLITSAVKAKIGTFAGVIAKMAKASGLEKVNVFGALSLSLDSLELPTGLTLADALEALLEAGKAPVAIVIDEAQHALSTQAGVDAMFALKAARDHLNQGSGQQGLPSSTVRAQKRPFSRSCPRSHAGFKAIFQKVV